MLYIELIPSTAWGLNVREVLTQNSWDEIRKFYYKKSHYSCDICNRKVKKLEAHEKWDFLDGDQGHKIIKLVGIYSLCKPCHMVKHFGLSSKMGKTNFCKEHLKRVNNWSTNQVVKHINESFKLFEERSKFDYVLDLSYLKRHSEMVSFKKKYKDISKFLLGN